MLEYPQKYILSIAQVAATAYGSVFMDVGGKVYWFGSNGKISKVPTPK